MVEDIGATVATVGLIIAAVSLAVDLNVSLPLPL